MGYIATYQGQQHRIHARSRSAALLAAQQIFQLSGDQREQVQLTSAEHLPAEKLAA